MATGDQFDYIRPQQLFRESGPAQVLSYIPATAQGATGAAGGVPLHKLDADGYQFVTRIWTNGTPLPTGLTFGLVLADDPNNQGAGLTVRVGITVKRIVSGTDDATLTSAGTEQVFTQAMAATSGIVTRKDCAIANANLDSAAAGDLVLVRIRRTGSNAADTHQGTVLLLGVSVRDT